MHDDNWKPREVESRVTGRFPANVILDEGQAAALDAQSGTSKSSSGGKSGSNSDKFRTAYGAFPGQSVENPARGADSGGASRFFKVIETGEEECRENHGTNDANTAGESFSPQSASLDSAPNGAATSEHRDTVKPTDSRSMNATESASGPSARSDTPQTPRSGNECSPEQLPGNTTRPLSPAKPAGPGTPTDTTTTTTGPWTSGGSAAPATYSTTPPSRGHGEPDSHEGSRFMYCAKAPKSERPVVDGLAHPTVKPLALMRYLVKLVTPPGGTVLDPFAGSGSTAEAALLEWFSCIAIEREPDYHPLIQTRLDRVYAAQIRELI